MNAHAPGWTCIGFATTIVVMLMGAVASAQFVPPTYPPPEFDPPISVTFDTGPFAPIAEIPPWSSITFQGFNVIYHVPNNPTGLVYFFHGGGGNAGIVRRVDITDILNELIASGFGFVSTSSTDRVANEWDHEPVTTNLDFLRMLDLRNALIANTEIETNSPLYAFGFSNGGSFSYTFSHLMSEMGLPISALATYESPGGQYALADPTIVQAPAFFVALENDIKPTVLLPAAIEHLATEVSASWPVDYHLGLEKSLNAERFLKIPGVTQTLAEALFDLLVGDGVIDATGLRLQNLNDLDGYEPNWSLLIGQPTDPGFSPMFFQDEVLRQLKIVWGQHVVSNEWRDEQVRWFLRYHPDAGDFDLDGDVDGFDFLKWQRDQSPNPLSASDLADWEANFGMAASLSANSVTVPEPSSAALLIVIAAVSILTRRPPGGSRSDSPFSA